MAEPQSSLSSKVRKIQWVLKDLPVALQDRDSDPLEQGAGLLTLQRIRKNTSVPLPSLQGRDQQAHYPGLKVCAAEAPGCPSVRLPPPTPVSPA